MAKKTKSGAFSVMKTEDLDELMKVYSKIAKYNVEKDDNGRWSVETTSGVKIFSITLWKRSGAEQSSVYLNIFHDDVSNWKEDLCTLSFKQGKYPVEEFLDLISVVINSILGL